MIPTLDQRCSHETHRRDDVYELPAHCYNCGTQYIAVISRGHEFNSGDRCPHCGVRYRWTTGTATEAKALRGSAQPARPAAEEG